MRAALFLSIVACGSEDRLHKIVACAADLDCPLGQICAADHSQCIAVNGDDIANWPAPKTSAELLSRFGRIAFSSSTDPGAQTVAFGGTLDTPAQQALQSASFNARASETTIELWATSFVGNGESLAIWNSAFSVPIQSIVISFDEVSMPILDQTYPQAAATADVTATVIANIGSDPNDTVPVTTTLSATLQATFGVTDDVLETTVHIEAHQQERTGTAGLLQAYDLVLDAKLTGNQVPSRWLP